MTPPATTPSPDTPAASSPDAQSTPDPAASSADPVIALLTDNTRNSTRPLSDTLDLGKLSPEKKALLEVLSLTSEGYGENELARALGHSPSWLSENLASLRQELLAQSGRLRDLTAAENESLANSIIANGVINPIILAQVDGRLDLIDGRNRYRIALEQGDIAEVPWLYLGQLTALQARELAFALNTARRHLTQEDKRDIVNAELIRDDTRSDRHIARICGVSNHTVASCRDKINADRAIMEEHDEPLDDDHDLIKTLDRPKVGRSPTSPQRRTGSDGKSYPVKERQPQARPNPTVACPTCGGSGRVSA